MYRRSVVLPLTATSLFACSKTQTSRAHAYVTIPTSGKASQLLAAVHAQTRHQVVYDSGYTHLDYPNGDVASDKGACSDVLIRAYRTLYIDLQKLVHEHMEAHFDLYPKTWGLKAPDPSIDHRHVPNLMVLFSRFAKVLSLSHDPETYQPGDILASHPIGPHIALVSDQKPKGLNRLLVIENIGGGVQKNDHLLSYPIIGHYRYAL